MSSTSPSESPATGASRGIRALAADTLVYGMARAVLGFVQLFLVPLYTRFFSVGEYGIIENLNSLGFFTLTLFAAALPTAVVQSYSRAEEPERRTIVSSATAAIAALGAALFGVGVLATAYLGPLLVKRSPGENGVLLGLAFLGYAFSLQLSVFLSVFRAQFDARRYLWSSLGSVVLTVALNLTFVAGLRLGIAGIFLASALAQLATIFYCIDALRPSLTLRNVSRVAIKRMVAFGFPFLFSAVVATLIRSSDRYFLSAFVDNPLPKIGLYSMAEKCMAPISLLTYAFGMAWAPFAMAVSKQADAQSTFVRSFKAYVAVTTALAVTLAGIAPLMLHVLATPAFYPAALFTPGVGIYLPLYYLYYIGSLGMLLTERSRALGPIAVVAAAVNVGLNWLWIPRFEVGGAIASTIASLVVYNLLMFVVGEKHHYVGFPIYRGLGLYALSYAAGTLALRGPGAACLGVGLQVAALRLCGFLELERLPGLLASVRRRL